SLLRQLLVAGYLKKDIETYGVIKLNASGKAFIKQPESFMMTEDHVFDSEDDGSIVTSAKASSGSADEALMGLLKDLRKKNAKKLGVPPFVIFQDPSWEDMALEYPISISEDRKSVVKGQTTSHTVDCVA